MPADPPPGQDQAGQRDEASAGPVAVDREALAAQALAQARADALARGGRPGGAAGGNGYESGNTAGVAASQQGRRPRREDPAPLGTAIDGLVAETGWELAVATGSVLGRWAQIVGQDLAAHTVPGGLADGELEVTADSTAWATQLRLLAPDLVRRLNIELGDGTVRRVKVLGPGAQSRRPGQWRVRGSRGPRDTYG